MSSKGRQIAKSIGKSIKKKFEADFFQFPFQLEDQQRDLIYLPAPPFNISPHSSPSLSDRKQMYQKMQSPKKSSSLGQIAVTEQQSPNIIDHEEIISLTQDVKKFSDMLAKLKLMFTEGFDSEDDPRVMIHEGLGEVLSVLNPVMQHYPALQSPEIFTAARSLITMIKDHNYEDEMSKSAVQNFCDAIDQLALAFSSSVSEYLMGDMGPQLVMDLKTKSMNNISVDDADESPSDSEALMSAEDLDGILVSLDTGLSLALQRAKVWSKYIADIITYIEKKAQLELDYAKNLTRLANTVQNSLKKEGFLPLQSIYCTALSQDSDFASNLQATQALLNSHKFAEPLAVRRADHDKVYKSVKDVWHREYKKMTDSVTNLRKAQALYLSRQQDRERAHDLALKADGEKQEKRRKAEEDAMHKAAEAETTYKACVAEANHRQQELFKVKSDQLSRIREQIQLCDQVIKDVTVEYFQLYHTIISPLPLQYQTLSESSKNYEPGSQYAEYIRRLPGTNRPCQPEVFMFEPYVQGQKSTPDDGRKESLHSNGSVSDNLHSPEGSPTASPRRDKYRIPVKAWGQQMPNVQTSDTDSASCSSKSHESSPSGSPHRVTRRPLLTSQSLDELTEEEILAAASAHNGQEKRVQHMKRTMTLAGDDSLDIPGLLLHHKGRRNTTFGIDFQEQVDKFQTKVPPIVSKCLVEIEKRGVMIKGIYRVSGVKSKVEHLCQRFDIDPGAVDLEDVHPNIISNVLKLYLRQLPEPLLTFRLYSDFIHTAKENMSGQLLGDNLVEHLKTLVIRLPSSNLRTCAVLMHHLQRVASHSELNQMSASNLGIVFGPTLLRPLEGSASLASLVDTPHQTRAVELLITYAHVIFGPSEDFQIAPSQTPVEQLDKVLSGVLMPGGLHPPGSSSSAPKSKASSAEPDDLSLPITEPTSGTPGAAASQPSPCDYVLPGTASQERNETQSLAINGLDLEDSEWRSDDDEDDSPDILLPDQSKPQSDPLSVALSPRCITVPKPGREASDTIRAGSSPGSISPARTPDFSGLARPKHAVTKSASSPVVSRPPKTHLSSSLSVPGSALDIAEGFSSPASGMSSSLITSSGSFTSSELSGFGLASSTSADSFGDSFSSKSTQVKKELPEGDEIKPVEEERSTLEDLAKKKLHSQQLKNIKYLTKAPSFDEPENDFYPKGTFSPPPSLSPTVSTGQGPKVTQTSDSFDLPSASQPTTAAVQESTTTTKTTEQKGKVPAYEASPQTPTKTTAGASVRKSILEEMPVPTVIRPRGPAALDGGGSGSDDGTIPAVTIPASPTIKRRELPSKIPTSPSTQRSADLRAAGFKGDDRADKFRQEQRKLVKAIKSDSKITAAIATTSESSPSTKTTTTMSSQDSKPKLSLSTAREEKRTSDVFDNDEVSFSGGCALSSRPSSQSEDMGSELDNPDTEEDRKPESKPRSEVKAASKSKDKDQAQPKTCDSPKLQTVSSPSRQLRSSTWAGKADPAKQAGESSPRQRPISSGGDSSSSLSKPVTGRARMLNMPSTVFVKKPATSSVTSTAVTKTTTVTSSKTTTPVTSKSISSPLTSTSPKSGATGRSPLKTGATLSAASGVTVKRTPSSSSTDQSPQMCSRAAASLSKLSDDSSSSSRSGSSVVRKSSGRSADLSSKAMKSTSGTESPPKGDGSSSGKSSPCSSQSSSPRHKHPSGDSTATALSRPAKTGQRKPALPSGPPTGSPRKIHERCQQDKPSSLGAKSSDKQGSSPSKTSTPRPSQLPTSSPATVSPATSQSETSPTSASVKLSQDRTPRFV